MLEHLGTLPDRNHPFPDDVLRVVEESDMEPDLDAATRETLCLCFPKDASVFAITRAWHGSAPAFSVVLLNASRVLAHAGVVDRIIRVGSIPLRVAGVQNVCVIPELRGRGLGAQIMREIEVQARKRQFDAGLLFCLPALERVYRACGWVSLGLRRVIRVEEGQEIPIPEKNIAMFLPLKIQECPPGPIHLQGNDW